MQRVAGQDAALPFSTVMKGTAQLKRESVLYLSEVIKHVTDFLQNSRAIWEKSSMFPHPSEWQGQSIPHFLGRISITDSCSSRCKLIRKNLDKVPTVISSICPNEMVWQLRDPIGSWLQSDRTRSMYQHYSGEQYKISLVLLHFWDKVSRPVTKGSLIKCFIFILLSRKVFFRISH